MSNIRTLDDLRNSSSPTRSNPVSNSVYQPGRAYPQANYQPTYSQPSEPQYGQPVYGQPVYGQPVYGQPVYARPIQGGPGQPVVYAQQASPKWYEWLFPRFNCKSFNFFIAMVDIILFIITLIYQGATKKDFTCVLYIFGAKFTPAITVYHQWHRVIVPMFLHGGWAHIFFNMLTQFMFGFVLEDFVGIKKYILLYILSGISGNLLSGVMYTENISVGASSALYGIFALQFCFLAQNYQQLGPRRNCLIMIWIIVVALNFATIPDGSNIDIGAHLGMFNVFFKH